MHIKCRRVNEMRTKRFGQWLENILLETDLIEELPGFDEANEQHCLPFY